MTSTGSLQPQVARAHYFTAAYLSPARLATYSYQLREVLALAPGNLLEVGVGGGLVLNAGTIFLGNETLNANGLGTGTVTLYGGVISMADNSATYNSFNANLVVPAAATACE